MKKYLFLIGFMDGADGPTDLHETKDLLIGYKSGNPNVDSVKIEAKSLEEAELKGYKWAFFKNYTAQDTLSYLIELR